MTIRMTMTAVIASLALIPAFASAALETTMTMKGTKQGMFKGSSQKDGDKIKVLSVHYTVQSPRDRATGQASGKRQHQNIVIVKEVDASSPQIMKAQSENEDLTEVRIEFYKSGKGGKQELDRTIVLMNATVAAVHRQLGGMKGGGREEVTLDFQKMETRNAGKSSKGTHQDDWAAH